MAVYFGWYFWQLQNGLYTAKRNYNTLGTFYSNKYEEIKLFAIFSRELLK